MRKRFKLIQTACRICGKPVMTGNRSLYGNDAAKARLDRICDDCVTDEERQEMETLRPRI